MHHAEPWYVNLHPYERYIEVCAGGTVAAYVPYDPRSDSLVQQQATARRIAACVNACEGIPTEDLEKRQVEQEVAEVAEALRNYMRLVKYLKRTTNPEEWASHGDWEKLERAAVEALDHAGEESEV